jgi:hypothetical protein
MKKLFSFFIGFVLFGTALLCNIVVKNDKSIEGLNLTTIVKMSTANAEHYLGYCYTYCSGDVTVCCFNGGSSCSTNMGALDGPYYQYH